jgi:hypothetical protein
MEGEDFRSVGVGLTAYREGNDNAAPAAQSLNTDPKSQTRLANRRVLTVLARVII